MWPQRGHSTIPRASSTPRSLTRVPPRQCQRSGAPSRPALVSPTSPLAASLGGGGGGGVQLEGVSFHFLTGEEGKLFEIAGPTRLVAPALDDEPPRRAAGDAPAEVGPAELWENIGFHRPVAGFLYNIPFLIAQLLLGLVFITWYLSVLYPFPESAGYRSVATGLFAIMFYSFDLGTMNLLNRFIGEANVKSPDLMLQYVQYFIWYQMLTGLVQTTIISVYALWFVPRQELAYAVWIMLVYSTVQYPGFLGIFRGVLGTMQQYHKTVVLNFISGEFVQRLTEVGFVLLGRWWGEQDPTVGPMLGIAIGATVGFYVDDFIATAFSAYYFRKFMRGYGITLLDCFRPQFDRQLVKTCLFWGVRSGLPNFMWSLEGFLSLYLWVTYVNQYTTFLALFNMVGQIGSLMGTSLELGGCMSEAFFNGKKHLAEYYLAQAFRYTGLMQCFILTILLLLLGILEPVLLFLQLDQYLLGVAFIVPKMVRDSQQPYNNFAENTTTSTGHVNFQMAIDVAEAVGAIVLLYLFIVWLQVPQTYGFRAIIWLIPCAELPAILAKVLLSYWYIHRRILRVKVPWYQAYGGPLIVTGIIFLAGRAYVDFVFFPLEARFGMVVALIPTLVVFVGIVPLFVFFPLTGLVGAWDPGSLAVFRRAAQMSGPGKFFAVPALALLERAAAISPLHGRFGVDDRVALREARELMALKNANRELEVKIL